MYKPGFLQQQKEQARACEGSQLAFLSCKGEIRSTENCAHWPEPTLLAFFPLAFGCTLPLILSFTFPFFLSGSLQMCFWNISMYETQTF